MFFLDLLSGACPLMLSAAGALFSEYAGALALFLDGLITFSGFLFFLFSGKTGSMVTGGILAVTVPAATVFIISRLIEKTKADRFISALGMNLLFQSAVSVLSVKFFGTRGVLSSPEFGIPLTMTKIISVVMTGIFISAAIVFLKNTESGICIRITGSDPDVLAARGKNPAIFRSASWAICALFGAAAGCLLTLRVSSFVPNIASGRGWTALAAVFLGNRNPYGTIISVLVICIADTAASGIQNFFPEIPAALPLVMPYIAALMMIIFVPRKKIHL